MANKIAAYDIHVLTDTGVNAVDAKAEKNKTDIEAASARIATLEADHVSTTDLTAVNAEIGTLKTDKANVTDLTAATGRISTLESDNVSVKNRLTAAEADIDSVEADTAKIHSLTAEQLSAATGYVGTLEAGNVTASNLVADHATVGSLDTNYAKINAANITDLSAQNAWVNKIMVQTGLIAHESDIFTLDAIQVNAANITAGTIDVNRLIVTVDGEKYLVSIDPTTSTPTYEKLDGGIVEPRTITADKIVAHDITVQEITTENLVGTNGWINLNAGKFRYTTNGTTLANSTNGIEWDGTNLTIKGTVNITSGNVYTKTEADNKYATQSALAVTNGAITAEVKARESATNLLLDTDVPSLTKVNASANRYFSDSGNASYMTMEFVELGTASPDAALHYAMRATLTSDVAGKARGLCWASASPLLKDGQTYTFTVWARATTGDAYISPRPFFGDKTGYYDYTLVSGGWKLYSWTFVCPADTDVSTYSTGYFYVNVAGHSKAAVIELCGFKLVAGDSIEQYSTTIEQTANNVLIKATSGDTTNAQGGQHLIQSLINVAPSGVKISADKVEIDGTATFNAIKSKADAAYDAIGSASAVQTNLDNLEIGGRNYIRNTELFKGWSNCGSGTAGTFDTTNGTFTYPAISANGWTEIRPNANVPYSLVKDSTVTLSAEVKGTSGQAISVMLDPYLSASLTGDRTKYRNVYLSLDGENPFGGNGVTVVADGTWQKVYATVTITDAFFTTGSGSGEYFGLRGARVNTNHNSYSIRRIKAEKGTKATDWTPAPEDVQSEIDAKKSVHTLTTNYSYSYANILTYSAEGYSGTWAVTSASGVQVGDTVRLKVTVSNMNNAPAYVVGTVTAVSGNNVTVASHGVDTTIIDGGNILTNSIGANQIKANAITADKLDATTINASEKLTVGAMTATEQAKILNSEIEIGGRNLYVIKDSYEGYLSGNSGNIAAMNNTRKEHTSEYIPVEEGENIIFQNWVTPSSTDSSEYLWMAYQFFDSEKAVVGSRPAKTKGAGTGTLQYDYYSVVVPTGASYIRVCARLYSDGLIKVEKGTKATDWTPAPEDVDSDISSAKAHYGICTTATATAAKIVTIDGFKLYDGAIVAVRFTSGNTVTSSVTLNVSGTGAKTIINGGASNNIPSVHTYGVLNLVYDATSGYWRIMNDHAATTATNYITAIDNNGIKVHAANNPSSNYAQINADGMTVYKGGTDVATFGSTVRIGKPPASDTGKVYIEDSKISIAKGGTVLTEFTPTGASIGANSNYAKINVCGERGIIEGSLSNNSYQLYVGGNIEASGSSYDAVVTKFGSNIGDSELAYVATQASPNNDAYVTMVANTDDLLHDGHISVSPNEIYLDVDPSTDRQAHFHITPWGASGLYTYGYGSSQAQICVEYGGQTASSALAGDSGDGVWLGYGDGGIAHGVYSRDIGKWIISSDADGVITSPMVYTKTTSGGSNVRVESGGHLKRYVSSSRRYKENIDDISDEALAPERLYDARVVQFKYRDDYLDKDDQRYGKLVSGFIAEELEEVYPIAVNYEEGMPEDWEAKFLLPPMLKLIQDQHKEIESLKERIEALEKR